MASRVLLSDARKSVVLKGRILGTSDGESQVKRRRHQRGHVPIQRRKKPLRQIGKVPSHRHIRRLTGCLHRFVATTILGSSSGKILQPLEQLSILTDPPLALGRKARNMVRSSTTRSMPTTDPPTNSRPLLRPTRAAVGIVLERDQLHRRLAHTEHVRPMSTRRGEERIGRSNERACLRLVLGDERAKVVVVDVKVGPKVARVGNRPDQVQHVPHCFAGDLGLGRDDQDGLASSTHSHNSHRSPSASLNVSKRLVAGTLASSGPSGPMSGSGSSRFPDAWRERERMVMVAVLRKPPGAECDTAMGADSAEGEF